MAGFVIHEIGDTLGPPKPLNCVGGWGSHEWQLSIEEGQVTLTTDCNLCRDGLWDCIEHDLCEMPPIGVTIAMELEPGQPQYGIDPYWWLQITPSPTTKDPS